MSESETRTGPCNCGCMGAGPALTDFLRRVGPSDAVSQHLRNAHIEMMKGLRTFLDEQIEKRSKPPAHGTRITVE